MSRLLELPPALLNRARRKRFRSGGERTLLLIDASYYIQRECARAFQRLGWKIVPVRIDPAEDYISRLLSAVVFESPDLMFTVNHLGFDADGIVAGILDQIELPAVSWFVDSPAYIILNHPGAVSEQIMTPVWERSEIETLHGLGFEHVFHLPLAADPELMRVSHPQPVGNTIGFVGDSMVTASAKWQARCSHLPGFESHLEAGISGVRSDRSNHPLKGAIPAGWSQEERLNFSSAVVLEATRRYRYESLRALINLPLSIWGDEGWQGAAPVGAIIAPRVDYYQDLPHVYQRTGVNLNFTSYQMPTGVNQRLFDTPAAGGFLLTDDQDDVRLLFDEDETATFGSLDELSSKAAWYLEHPVAREKIWTRALARILKEHTYLHRIERIVSEVVSRFSFPKVGVTITVSQDMIIDQG